MLFYMNIRYLQVYIIPLNIYLSFYKGFYKGKVKATKEDNKLIIIKKSYSNTILQEGKVTLKEILKTYKI